MSNGTGCTCRGCCLFPNGMVGILALIIGIIACICGIIANFSCYFVTLDMSEMVDFPFRSEGFGFGLWNHEKYNNDCTGYTSRENDILFDANWKAARAMAVIATLCGAFCMITCICLSCVSIPKRFLFWTAVLSGLAGLFQSLVFIAYSSDFWKNYDSKFGWGSGIVIAALVLYFANACVIYSIPEPREEKEDGPGVATAAAVTPATKDIPLGAVQVTTTVLPDGTKKTTRITVNADGSKTVEETTETPATGAGGGAPMVPAKTV